MTAFLRFVREHTQKTSYYVWLATAVVGYFAASRFVQDWIYRRLPPTRAQLDTFPPFSVLPEPYETPLYLAGYLVIPLVAFGFSWIWTRIGERLWPYRWYALGGLGVIVSVVAAAQLSRFSIDRAFEYVARRGLGHILWLLLTKRLFVVQVAFLVALGCFVVLRYCWRQPNGVWFRRWRVDPRFRLFAPWFFIALALLVFTPNFPYEQQHYNYLLGTVNDMHHGKAFLYETTNQYGILSVYLLAFLFQTVLPLSYPALSLVLAASFYLFFIALYVFIRRWLHSDFLALVGTTTALVVVYFMQVDPFRAAMIYPGPTPFRHGFFIVVLLALTAYLARPTTIRRNVALFLGALAPFWSVDAGLYALVATAGVFVYLVYDAHRDASWPTIAREVVRVGIRLFGYVVAIFLVLSFLNVIRFGAWPHWELIWQAVTFYSTGFGELPMPAIGVFELYVAFYLAVAVWIIGKILRGHRVDPVAVFLALYGIFSFLYYVGNSAWSYLPAISAPVILLALYHIDRMFAVEPVSPRAVWSFAAAFSFIAFLFVVKVPTEFAKRDYANVRANFTAIRAEDADLHADALVIRRRFPAATRIPLFHLTDTKLLIFADKANVFPLYDTWNIIARSRLAALIADVQASPPPYLFIGRTHDARLDEFTARVGPRYTKVESLRTLGIYQRNDL